MPGLFVVAVTWLGARLAVEGELSVGALVAFYGYTAFLVLPLRTDHRDRHTAGPLRGWPPVGRSRCSSSSAP